jgi:hypothetical protein
VDPIQGYLRNHFQRFLGLLWSPLVVKPSSYSGLTGEIDMISQGFLLSISKVCLPIPFILQKYVGWNIWNHEVLHLIDKVQILSGIWNQFLWIRAQTHMPNFCDQEMSQFLSCFNDWNASWISFFLSEYHYAKFLWSRNVSILCFNDWNASFLMAFLRAEQRSTQEF